MSRYKTLLKDTAIFAVGNLGSKLILFFMVPLYTNFMTTDEYGISDLVFTVAQLIVPFTSLVIFDAIQRFGLSKYEKSENVLLSGLLVCAAGSLVMLSATPLMRLYPSIAEWRWYLSIYVVLNMFGSTEMNYLKTQDKNQLYALFSILQTLLLASCNVALLCWKGMGIRGYLLSTCVSSCVPVLMPFFAGGLLRELKRATIDRDLIRRMVVFSSPLVLNNVSWWAIHSFDKLVIESMLGAAALGIYTVATKMPSLVNVMTSIFSQAWGISSVREFESDNDTSYYSSVLKVLVCLVFGATMLLVAVMKPFMNLYVGRDFSDAWRYVPLLLVSASFYSVGSFFGSMYGALKKSINNMITTVLSAVTCIAVTLVFVPHVGIWGAAVGTFAAFFTLMVARVVDVGRFLSIDTGGWRLWASAAVITLQAVLVPHFQSFGLLISVILIACFGLINGDVLVSAAKRLLPKRP